MAPSAVSGLGTFVDFLVGIAEQEADIKFWVFRLDAYHLCPVRRVERALVFNDDALLRKGEVREIEGRREVGNADCFIEVIYVIVSQGFRSPHLKL